MIWSPILKQATVVRGADPIGRDGVFYSDGYARKCRQNFASAIGLIYRFRLGECVSGVDRDNRVQLVVESVDSGKARLD